MFAPNVYDAFCGFSSNNTYRGGHGDNKPFPYYLGKTSNPSMPQKKDQIPNSLKLMVHYYNTNNKSACRQICHDKECIMYNDYNNLNIEKNDQGIHVATINIKTDQISIDEVDEKLIFNWTKDPDPEFDPSIESLLNFLSERSVRNININISDLLNFLLTYDVKTFESLIETLNNCMSLGEFKYDNKVIGCLIFVDDSGKVYNTIKAYQTKYMKDKYRKFLEEKQRKERISRLRHY